MVNAGRGYTVLFCFLSFVLCVRLTHATTRMATDLNLHHSLTARAANEHQARELANRVRIWINCFNVDRSTSTQFGKPSTIKEDYIARHTMFWYRQSGFNYDIHLCGYTQMLRVMARFHEAIYSDPDAPTGLNKVGWVSFCAVYFRMVLIG
jgi:Fungal specific transcription factor domain